MYRPIGKAVLTISERKKIEKNSIFPLTKYIPYDIIVS
jgi:hypothetical protein